MHAREPAPNPALNDPEFGELMDYFRGELPARVRALERCAAARDRAEVQRIAHQLKGAAPGFGFADVGRAAARVEEALRADAEASIDRVRADLDALIAICRSYFPRRRQGL